VDIGFIGLGHMGFPIARRMVAAGHNVIAFDTRAEVVETLVGARAAASARDVADNAETVMVSLPSPQASRDVATAVAEGSRIKRFVDFSTVGRQTAIEVHVLLARRGIVAIDSPVSGGVSGANSGTLAVMVSAPRDDFELLTPVYEAIGRAFYLGDKPARRRR
jgi:3-hydroxyisobutyrate dehydrogenase-like beta-hydroxyacid dehydrogenase